MRTPASATTVGPRPHVCVVPGQVADLAVTKPQRDGESVGEAVLARQVELGFGGLQLLLIILVIRS